MAYKNIEPKVAAVNANSVCRQMSQNIAEQEFAAPDEFVAEVQWSMAIRKLIAGLEFGEALKLLMNDRDMSVEQMESESGLSVSTVKRLRAGQEASAEQIVAISVALRLPPITCSFAAEGVTFTMGFICDGYSKPKTLLRGKKLDPNRTGTLELVLRRKRGEDKFNEILVGNEEILKKYADKVQTQLSDDLLSVVNPTPAEQSGESIAEQAKFELLAEMVKEEQIGIEIAASKIQISVEEFSSRMNKDTLKE